MADSNTSVEDLQGDQEFCVSDYYKTDEDMASSLLSTTCEITRDDHLIASDQSDDSDVGIVTITLPTTNTKIINQAASRISTKLEVNFSPFTCENDIIRAAYNRNSYYDRASNQYYYADVRSKKYYSVNADGLHINKVLMRMLDECMSVQRELASEIGEKTMQIFNKHHLRKVQPIAIRLLVLATMIQKLLNFRAYVTQCVFGYDPYAMFFQSYIICYSYITYARDSLWALYLPDDINKTNGKNHIYKLEEQICKTVCRDYDILDLFLF